MHQIFYLTVDPERSLGIEDLIPSYHILYSQPSQLASPIASNGVDIKNFSSGSEAKEQSTLHLLKNENVKKYIDQMAHGVADLLVFRNDSSIQGATNALGYTLLNGNVELGRILENKVDSLSLLEEANTFKLPKRIILDKLQDADYANLKSELGEGFVLQFMVGRSGSSTHFISNEGELTRVKTELPLRKVKFTQQIYGPAYTINACVIDAGVVIGGISEQITGVEQLTSSKGGTVGNDFTQRHLDSSLRQELIKQTVDFGNFLKGKGYRGIFGLDLVLDQSGEFFLIEVNPRQTLSSSFVSYLQRHNRNVPLMLWHVLELLKHNHSEDFFSLLESEQDWLNSEMKLFLHGDQMEYNLRTNMPLEASQVFYRNTKPHAVKVLEQFPSGIYRMRGRDAQQAAELEGEGRYTQTYKLREDGWSTLALISRGYNILEADRLNGFLIMSAAENSVIGPLGELGRIQSLSSAFTSKEGYELNGWIKDTVSAIYENMQLVELR